MRLSRVLYYSEPIFFTISTAEDEPADSKATTSDIGLMNEYEIIAWGKEEEAILRSNEWNLIR